MSSISQPVSLLAISYPEFRAINYRKQFNFPEFMSTVVCESNVYYAYVTKESWKLWRLLSRYELYPGCCVRWWNSYKNVV